MSTRTRKNPTIRKAEILDAAVAVAVAEGLRGATRDLIAARVGVSPALISMHYSTMDQLRRAVMRAAVEREVLPLVAEGLAMRDPHALKAPEDLRRRAADSLTKG
jgi:AcrR family transcriptional regulator